MAIKSVAELHEALSQVDEVTSELVLLRKCADVCNIVHLLRAAGPFIEAALLDKYDYVLTSSLSHCLGGDLDDLSVMQAHLGVTQKKLGFRRARDLTLPDFVASETECRWLNKLLADALSLFLSRI